MVVCDKFCTLLEEFFLKHGLIVDWVMALSVSIGEVEKLTNCTVVQGGKISELAIVQ